MKQQRRSSVFQKLWTCNVRSLHTMYLRQVSMMHNGQDAVIRRSSAEKCHPRAGKPISRPLKYGRYPLTQLAVVLHVTGWERMLPAASMPVYYRRKVRVVCFACNKRAISYRGPVKATNISIRARAGIDIWSSISFYTCSFILGLGALEAGTR
jgi:hypothetical protein